VTRPVGSTLVLCVALLATALTWSASRRQSATFDEIILVSGGVRGVSQGEWGMVTDQPPLMMWLYGWASRGAVSETPSEERAWDFESRWDYARLLFFGLENDAQAVLGRARLVTAAMAGGIVVAAGGLAWWAAGPQAGVLAAALTAFLPDVLAHGGVAYNDLPLAFVFLLAVWALDALVRAPTPIRGSLAGLAVAATFGMKMSALALLPIAVLLFGVEAWLRYGDRGRLLDRAWLRDVAVAVLCSGLAAWFVLVAMYAGDPTLTALRFNFWRTVLHTTGGHPAPAWLLGDTSVGGWWYYFPVAFLFKVPAAFQMLVVIATASLGLALRDGQDRLRRVCAWRGRAPLLALLVFGGFLLRSDLNAGFRYALPVLPLLAVVTALGLMKGRALVAGAAIRPTARSGWTVAVGALVVMHAVTVLSFYPHWLAYTSVWAGGRDRGWTVLADSNIDWGQGLLELRSFMAREGVTSVSLSYFGSARPEAYGIDYVALPSFFRLTPERTENAEVSPRFTVISANNLLGLYMQGRDPFAGYRDREPYRVLGHALFVYDELADR